MNDQSMHVARLDTGLLDLRALLLWQLLQHRVDHLLLLHHLAQSMSAAPFFPCTPGPEYASGLSPTKNKHEHHGRPCIDPAEKNTTGIVRVHLICL